MIWYAILLAPMVLSSMSAASAQTTRPGLGENTPGIEFFEKTIRPILVEHCYTCHGSSRQKAGLRLDDLTFILRGGDRGAAIIPGDPDQSRLIQAVRYIDEKLRMPPKGKLNDEQITDLTTWVRMGAPGPKLDEAMLAFTAESLDIAQRRVEHWAWWPVGATVPPPTTDTAWGREPIDQFILAKLEMAGLPPAPRAARRALIRRAYFDLIGLPPTPGEVQTFLVDDSPDAFERVVDRLLASPQFGERWARHWLDLVRYAETRGHEFDHIIPNAYQYRDYVIRALNADLPYDQFITEHVAGDLVANPRLHPTEGFNESVLGTGFWFLGEELHSPVDIRGDETDRLDNKIDVFTKTFLGLTVSCARCHDHKFDAISTKDYYALAGFLLSSSYRQVPFGSMEQNRRVARELESLREQSRAAIVRAVADELKPEVERVAEHLLAAWEALRSQTASRASPLSDALDEVAAMRGIDAARLNHWVDYIQKARRDWNDPLHAWAIVAKEVSDAPERIDSHLEVLADAGRTQVSKVAESWSRLRVIVDYGRPRDDDWLQDGVTFGSRPTRPGDVQFSLDPARPVSEVLQFAAARADATWNLLQPPSDNEKDPGKVSWGQAARTIRTRTFTLNGGNVFYLVRGAGRAYAAVDSHRLIDGPLHGSLVKNWEAAADQGPHWVEHSLASYSGHRVHIEFSPREPIPEKATLSNPLEILAVVEAEQVPIEPATPQAILLGRLVAAQANSPEALARAYQQQLVEAIDQFGADAIIGAPEAQLSAWLADWVMSHPDLIPPDRVTGGRTLVETARPFFEERTELTSKIRRTSRTAPALLEGSRVDEHVLLRGNHRTPGELVPRRFLEAISDASWSLLPTGCGRLELARQVTDPANPLVARVMVNRVWHHLFGRGIVASVDNFGVLGERPTHPELLDYLAARFIDDGWSIKRLIRGLVLSSTYQSSMQRDPQADRVDPQNVLLQHMPMRRVEGEAIRDAILAVSGRVDRTMFGPSIEVHLTPFMEGRGRPDVSGPLDGAGRRSIYLRVRRNFPHPMLAAFDAPTPFTTIGRRSVSNVPAQALSLMNSPFVVDQSRLWAERILSEANQSTAQRVTAMYETAFARPPTPDELAEALAFLERHTTDGDAPRGSLSIWADLCHVLFNVKEFVFLE